jgi:hypothetical protein
MHDETPFRIKSPQLYQLSYRPKHTEPADMSASDDSGEWSTVPAMCPRPARRQATTARLGAWLYWPVLT